MSLLDYKSARPWSKAMRQAVMTRKMPPWLADPHYGAFSNDARLSGAELADQEFHHGASVLRGVDVARAEVSGEQLVAAEDV